MARQWILAGPLRQGPEVGGLLREKEYKIISTELLGPSWALEEFCAMQVRGPEA